MSNTLYCTFRSVRIFSTQALTTAIGSTASQPRAAALMDNSLTVEAKTMNVIGFRGFSNFLLFEGGDQKKKERKKLKDYAVLVG